MVLIGEGSKAMRIVMMVAMVGAVVAVSGCERLGLSRKAQAERALPFRASMKDAKDGTLTVSVKAPGASVDAVRESVRFPVTRHCLQQRGSSTADWVLNPTTGDWAYAVDAGGTMTFTARCRA